MKTIQQTQEIEFSSITIQDAITLLPLMNYLKHQAELDATETAYKALSKEERSNYRWVPSPEIPNAAVYFKKLQEHGYVAEDDTPITHHLEDYRKD